jgi:WD40 repeat protein
VLFAGVEEHAGIFALDTGRLVVRLVDARMDIHQASFSREGRRLLVVWGEQGVETVDAVTGRTLAALSGAEEGIADVDFAPGGERVAAGLLDGTLVVWEAATGERVASLTRAEGTVTSVVFSSDGSHLATGTESGVARIWSVAPPCPAPDFDEALRRACAILRWTEAWERRSQLRTHCPAPH